MGANIYYRQDKPLKGMDVNTGTPSSFWQNLEKVSSSYGNDEIYLDNTHIPILTGLAIINEDYSQLIEAINKLNAIIVYRKW